MTSEQDVGTERGADTPAASNGKDAGYAATGDPPLIGGAGLTSLNIIDRKRLVNRRTILWIFCGVLFALFPIYSEIVKQISTSGLDMTELLKKGEQFVIGGVVALGAAGEVLAASVPEELKNYSLTAGLCAILAAVANILVYVYASTAGVGVLISLTSIIGSSTLLVSLICVRTAAGR